jgi:hypothetical protein
MEDAAKEVPTDDESSFEDEVGVGESDFETIHFALSTVVAFSPTFCVNKVLLATFTTSVMSARPPSSLLFFWIPQPQVRFLSLLLFSGSLNRN